MTFLLAMELLAFAALYLLVGAILCRELKAVIRSDHQDIASHPCKSFTAAAGNCTSVTMVTSVTIAYRQLGPLSAVINQVSI